MPDKAYQVIDQILTLRPDITFRLFHFLCEDTIDIAFLKKMPHLSRLAIDIHLRDRQEAINLDVLTTLKLKELILDCFDLRDYGFVQNLSDGLENLTIMADTMGPGVNFDCSWLLKYNKLNTLWLGKKTKKNLECISQISSLKALSLRGIKLTDFSWLKQMQLESFALLWNSNNDLHELAELKGLKEIELWRINKLSDISFMEDLKELETIKLQDLKHITRLPDLSKHTKLQRVFLLGVAIDRNTIPDYLQDKICTKMYV